MNYKSGVAPFQINDLKTHGTTPSQVLFIYFLPNEFFFNDTLVKINKNNIK